MVVLTLRTGMIKKITNNLHKSGVTERPAKRIAIRQSPKVEEFERNESDRKLCAKLQTVADQVPKKLARNVDKFNHQPVLR